MTTLIMLSLLPWLFVLFHKISHRGLAVLLLWLLISPIATNLISRPSANPLFRSPVEHSQRHSRHGDYFLPENDARLEQLLEPTRTLFIAFVAAILLNTILKKTRLGPFDKTEIWMGLFSLILLGSVFFKSNRFDYSMRVASDAFIVPFAAYFVARRYVRTEEHLRQLVRVICWMGFTIIVTCIVERLLHEGITYRLAGPFRNPGTLYIVLMVAFFLALLDTLHAAGRPDGRQALHPLIRRTLLCIAPVIFLLTWARANYVGFLAGIGMFIFLGRKLLGHSQKISMIAVGLLALPVIYFSVSGLEPNESAMKRLGASGTVYGRLATWKIALDQGLSHPFVGIGLNNMKDALAASTTEVEGVRSWPSVHNSFLAIFAEQGFIGIAAYLAIVMSIIGMGQSLYKTGAHIRDKWRGVAVIVVMVAYLMPSFSASMLHEPIPIQAIFMFSFIGAISGIYRRGFATQLHTSTGVAQNAVPLHGDRTTALMASSSRKG